MHSKPPARGDWDRSVAGYRVRIMVCDTARRPRVGDCDTCPCFYNRGSLRRSGRGWPPTMSLTRSTSGPQDGRCLAGKGDVVVDFLHVIAIVEHA
jgi:hypothetical protein